MALFMAFLTAAQAEEQMLHPNPGGSGHQTPALTQCLEAAEQRVAHADVLRMLAA